MSAPACLVLSQRWLVENISRSLPGVRGVRFELELELELGLTLLLWGTSQKGIFDYIYTLLSHSIRIKTLEATMKHTFIKSKYFGA